MTNPSADEGDLLDAALSRLMLAAVMMADDMERGLAERGLTRVRATALWEIHHRAPVTQRALADALKVTPRNVTTLIDALEKTGFARRMDHPGDRRATIIALTPKGRKAVARMKAEKQAFASALFDGVDTAALRQFIGTLDGVIGRLERQAA